MGSTLPHLKDAQKFLMDGYWTREPVAAEKATTFAGSPEIVTQRIVCITGRTSGQKVQKR